jgi:hypothetical protein
VIFPLDANIVLPQGSKAHRLAFDKSSLLGARFGEEAGSIVTGLVHRFDNFPVHKICYDPTSITSQELRECIERTKDEDSPLVDGFGMTAFHVFFSTGEPSADLLKVLLETYTYRTGILDCQDATY